jgi:bifunctional ADP-heptose synthase (sugar kinase/adenylyltransferase)
VKYFIYGDFDLLHKGHLSLLEYCDDLRNSADRMKKQGRVRVDSWGEVVVGLSSDKTISKIKGHGRPITKQDDRAFTLKTLPFVDVVHIYEDNPRELIEKLEPYLILRGSDSKEDTWLHSFGKEMQNEEITKGYDVKVYPSLKGYGTTEIINKVLRPPSP